MHNDPANPICKGSISIQEYKFHVYNSINNFLEKTGFKYDYITGHIPFPAMIDWMHNFEYEKKNHPELYKINPFKQMTLKEYKERFKHNYLPEVIGNTYVPNTGFNLIEFLNHAITGQRGLWYGYGSGATCYTVGVVVTDEIKDYDRSIKVTDSLSYDNRFELDDLAYDENMDDRINEKATLHEPFEFLKENNASIVKKSKINGDARLIKYNGKESLIEFNGKVYKAEVYGCKNLDPGKILEFNYKHNRIVGADNKELIHYTPMYREKLDLSSSQ
jgi:3-hydroxy-3-methylglutaryl CoA synthase